MRELPRLSSLSQPLEYLISSGNSQTDAQKKSEIIENISNTISKELKVQGLTSHTDTEMERQAYIINDTIGDSQIRNMHILCAV